MTQMYTLRRGTTSCGIHSMSFNAAATRLAVSSSNRTIHIFDVSAGGGAAGAGAGAGGGGERARAGRRPSSSSSGHSPREGARGNGVGGHGQEEDAENGGSSSSSSSSLASGFRSVVGMLPNRVTKRMQDYVDCERSYASVRLRGSAGRSICALIPAGDPGKGAEGEEGEEEGEILLVVTSEGILYSYIVDTVNGGECRLDEASSLLMDPSASQEIGSELFDPDRHAPPVVPNTVS